MQSVIQIKAEQEEPSPVLDEPGAEKPFFHVDDDFLKRLEGLKKPILKSIEPKGIYTFRYYNLRYFENRYSVDFYKKQWLDILVRVHSNKLMLLALAEGNYIMQSDHKVKEISFVVNHTDRSLIKTKGKRKLGARKLHKHTKICQVLLEGDDQWHTVRAGVEGYLVEANEYIKQQPNLIKEDPNGMGYFVIVMPKGPLHNNENTIDNMDLLKEDDYFKYLSQRSTQPKSC